MTVLFVLLSIQTNESTMYLEAAKQTVKELLHHTPHSVLLTTNNVEFFSDITDSRFTVRNKINETHTLTYGSEFNFNLKHLAFESLPETYDIIFYVDCDIKLNFWTEESQAHLESLMAKHDYLATRLNCCLRDELNNHRNGGALFSHKIRSYNIEQYSAEDTIFNSLLPSEHFLVFKNIPDKIKKFAYKWGELNKELQGVRDAASWGDGFEMGIASNYAGFLENYHDFNYSDLELKFGFLFNGNKK